MSCLGPPLNHQESQLTLYSPYADEQAASQCAQVQEQYIKELEQVARSQLDQDKHGGGEYTSLTIREILEMERSS